MVKSPRQGLVERPKGKPAASTITVVNEVNLLLLNFYFELTNYYY